MLIRFCGLIVEANSAASVQSEFHEVNVPRKILKSTRFFGGEGAISVSGSGGKPEPGRGLEQRQQVSN